VKDKNILFSLLASFLLIFIQGCDWGQKTIENHDVDILNAAIKKDPTFLDNKRITNTTLYKVIDPNHPELGHGLILENMVIRNFIMSNVTLYNVQFKNVTFVDCSFIKTLIKDGAFENVKFIRGNLFAYDEPDAYEPPKTRFEGIKTDRVLFDGVKIGENAQIRLHEGLVVMRNVIVDARRSERDYDSFLLGGKNLHIRIDRCAVTNETGIFIAGDKSSAYITNSTFNNSDIDIKGTAAWVENCTITNSQLPSSKIVIIKKNKLATIGAYNEYENGKMFFVENDYNYLPGKNNRTVNIFSKKNNVVPYIYI